MTLALVYGVFPHEGIVVLRRDADGALIDRDNAWVTGWDEAITEWCDSDPQERVDVEAEGDGCGLGWPSAGFTDDADDGGIGKALEVISAGDDVGNGTRHVFVNAEMEGALLHRAAGLGLDIVRDDDLVDAKADRSLGTCPCSMTKADDAFPLDFSRTYNMLSSVDRGGQIVHHASGWSLDVCPYEIDAGDLIVWVDAWSFSLDDAQELVDTFTSDDYSVNVIETELGEILAALWATGVPELATLAQEVEELTE